MELRIAGLILVVLVGTLLVGYGLSVGDEARYSLDVQEGMNESELGDIPVVEYDHLDPDMQDAFREALRTNETVSITENPDFESSSAVHYEDTYYPTVVIVSDAVKTTMIFSIAGGIGLILTGTIGLYVSRRET